MGDRYRSLRPSVEQIANARGLPATEWVLSEVKYGSTLLGAARGMEPKRALGRSVPVRDECLQDRALWGVDGYGISERKKFTRC